MEHDPGKAARRTLAAEPGQLECWLRPLLLASVMYAEPHLPCCASTVWQEMNQGVLRGMLERKQAVCTRCKVIAKSLRADSSFAQVGQGQKLNPVVLSTVDLIRPLVIEVNGQGSRRSVRAIPCLARALAPQPLHCVLCRLVPTALETQIWSTGRAQSPP